VAEPGRAQDADVRVVGARTNGLEPVSVGIFGGAIVPETLHFPFSHVPAGDLRDWDEIRKWSARLPEALGVRALAV